MKKLFNLIKKHQESVRESEEIIEINYLIEESKKNINNITYAKRLWKEANEKYNKFCQKNNITYHNINSKINNAAFLFMEAQSSFQNA